MGLKSNSKGFCSSNYTTVVHGSGLVLSHNSASVVVRGGTVSSLTVNVPDWSKMLEEDFTEILRLKADLDEFEFDGSRDISLWRDSRRERGCFLFMKVLSNLLVLYDLYDDKYVEFCWVFLNILMTRYNISTNMMIIHLLILKMEGSYVTFTRPKAWY